MLAITDLPLLDALFVGLGKVIYKAKQLRDTVFSHGWGLGPKVEFERFTRGPYSTFFN